MAIYFLDEKSQMGLAKHNNAIFDIIDEVIY